MLLYILLVVSLDLDECRDIENCVSWRICTFLL